ncbi:MAG: hemolysin III family protein [Clostridia bacterium]|nr:hemolysin III family protein [Clostridia bacterium]
MQTRRRGKTRFKDRPLPTYTRGEEIFNMVSHIVGGAIGIAALTLCIIFSAVRGNGYGLAGSIIYGISMITLYTMSSVYHGLKDGVAKRVMQVLDHCTIYLLIAGTYTPILLSAMRPIDPAASWILLGVVWGLAAIAITLTAIDMHKYAVFSMICYIGMGWCIVVKIPLLIQAVTWGGFWLLLAGGLCYTVGAVLYGVGRKRRYMHSIFHLCVLAGSVLHLLAILIYAL